MTTLMIPAVLSPTPGVVTTPSGPAPRILPPTFIVATVQSSSRPGAIHAVLGRDDGTFGCSCEAGVFRPQSPCRHIKALKASNITGASVTPCGWVALGFIKVEE